MESIRFRNDTLNSAIWRTIDNQQEALRLFMEEPFLTWASGGYNNALVLFKFNPIKFKV